MSLKELDPKDCQRWKYADRSAFEMGDLYLLAEDIKKNGQIEPIIVRALKGNNDIHYEVIAGSRRWQACLQHNLPIKAIVHDLDDKEAMVVQIKENEKEEICDYSKGLFFSSLLQDSKTSQKELLEATGLSKTQLLRFLCFEKVPASIWNAIKVMSKVSVRAAQTIYELSQKGELYVDALIDISDEIKKGAGSRRIEKMVQELLGSEVEGIDTSSYIFFTDGRKLGEWTKTGIKFDKTLPINQKKLSQNLVKFFEKKKYIGITLAIHR